MSDDEGGSVEADAFRTLFNLHARAVHAYCARRTADLVLAEDLTSIVFLEAWRHRHRVGLVEQENPLPWLLGVANNVVRNDLRARIRYRAAVRRLAPTSVVDAGDDRVVDRADAERGLGEALSAIAALSAGERDVVALVLWSGLSYEEAAVALDVPVGTVRSRLSRARAKVRSSLPESLQLAKECT